MGKLFFGLIIFIIATLTCCKRNYGKEFYGSYEGIATETKFIYTFFPGNIYSFSQRGMCPPQHDSGTFVLKEDTLYFTSFNPVKYDTITFKVTLTGKKLLYENGKIYAPYIDSLGKLVVDTTIFLTKSITKK